MKSIMFLMSSLCLHLSFLISTPIVSFMSIGASSSSSPVCCYVSGLGIVYASRHVLARVLNWPAILAPSAEALDGNEGSLFGSNHTHFSRLGFTRQHSPLETAHVVDVYTALSNNSKGDDMSVVVRSILLCHLVGCVGFPVNLTCDVLLRQIICPASSVSNTWKRFLFPVSDNINNDSRNNVFDDSDDDHIEATISSNHVEVFVAIGTLTSTTSFSFPQLRHAVIRLDGFNPSPAASRFLRSHCKHLYSLDVHACDTDGPVFMFNMNTDKFKTKCKELRVLSISGYYAQESQRLVEAASYRALHAICFAPNSKVCALALVGSCQTFDYNTFFFDIGNEKSATSLSSGARIKELGLIHASKRIHSEKLKRVVPNLEVLNLNFMSGLNEAYLEHIATAWKGTLKTLIVSLLSLVPLSCKTRDAVKKEEERMRGKLRAIAPNLIVI